MTSEGRFLGTALESTQKAVSLVQEQLGGQGGVLGGLLALTCSIRQKPSVDSASSRSPEPRLARSPAMLTASKLSLGSPAAAPAPRLSATQRGLAPPGHRRQQPLPQLGARLPAAESRVLQPSAAGSVPSPARSREPAGRAARARSRARADRRGRARTAAGARAGPRGAGSGGAGGGVWDGGGSPGLGVAKGRSGCGSGRCMHYQRSLGPSACVSGTQRVCRERRCARYTCASYDGMTVHAYTPASARERAQTPCCGHFCIVGPRALCACISVLALRGHIL